LELGRSIQHGERSEGVFGIVVAVVVVV